MYYFDGVSTPLGRLHIVVSDAALCHIYFPTEKWTERHERDPKHPLIILAKTQLAEYFAGERRIFDIPLDLGGSEFQKKVWSVLRKIPYGETLSYGEEAKKVGKAAAARAVGSEVFDVVIHSHEKHHHGGGGPLAHRQRNQSAAKPRGRRQRRRHQQQQRQIRNPFGQQDPPAGFTALFNGRDLSGWYGWTTRDPKELWAMSAEEQAK